MYSYITNMCKKCVGCALSNATKRRLSELIYSFPIEAPLKVMHIDSYTAERHQSFEGDELYLVACCGMCTFAVMEPIAKGTSTSFASAIMKIMLCFGFSHTVVVDKDSKFFGQCKDALQLLKINVHVLSGANHDPMLVERICPFLNSGLQIMTNEQDSVQVAMESILLLLYAWDSCPIPISLAVW